MTHDDGGPAFPVPMIPMGGSGEYTSIQFGGMSLRDWFAGKALAAELRNGDINTPRFVLLVKMAEAEGGTVASLIARECYAMADAMLAARRTL